MSYTAGVPIAILVELPIKKYPRPKHQTSPTRWNEVALEVQKWILPRWGFDPSIHGAQEAETAIAAVPWSLKPRSPAPRPRGRTSCGNFLGMLQPSITKNGKGVCNIPWPEAEATLILGHDIFLARHCISKAKRRATDAHSATLQRLSEAVTRSGLEIRGQPLRLEGMLLVFWGKGVVTACFFHMIFLSATSVSGQWKLYTLRLVLSKWFWRNQEMIINQILFL